MPITSVYVGQIGQDVVESLKNRQATEKKGQKRHMNTGWTQSTTRDLILGFLLSRWLRVRISSRSQKPLKNRGFLMQRGTHRSQVCLRYANQDSTLRPDWTILGVKMRSFWREGTKDPELIGLSNSQKSRCLDNKSILQ